MKGDPFSLVFKMVKQRKSIVLDFPEVCSPLIPEKDTLSELGQPDLERSESTCGRGADNEE